MATPLTSTEKSSAPKPLNKGRRRIPRWALYCAAIVVLGVGWYGWKRFRSGDAGVGAIVTGKVVVGDLIETVSATGSIAAQTGAEVKIGSQITGRIKRLYADVGTKVKAGDLIAELDLPDVKAQVDQTKASYSATLAKLLQQQQNVMLGQSQTQSSIAQARAGLTSAKQRLKAAKAGAKLQTVQTPVDIRRAEALLKQAKAALSTSRSSLAQVQAGASLQILSAQEVVAQAKATDLSNQTNLTRQLALLAKGYVAQQVVDRAQQAADVSQSQVRTSQQALELTKQKVTADVQASKDQVTQAQQGIESASAGLLAAQGGSYSIEAKNADVADAEAAVAEAQASLQLATGNLTSNSVRAQDVQVARESVKQAAAQIAVSQAQLDKTFIRSPISGTVLQLASQQGETLAAGLSAPTLIIVADLTKLEVDAYVDETDIGKVKIGQPVKVTIDAFPDRVLTGKVSKVASGSTIQQGVVTYGVTIFIENTSQDLKPDMTASVTIQTGKMSNVLIVPSVAVQVGVNGSTVNVITKKDGNSAIKAMPVKTGGSDGVNTEILSGLKEGDVIVLAGGQSATKRAATATSPFSTGGGGGGGRGGH